MRNLTDSKSGALTATVCLFALVVIAAFWSTAYMLTQQDRVRTLAEAYDENRNLARTLSEHATRTFDYADRIALEVKAAHERTGRVDLSRVGSAGNINRNIVVGVFVVDARGDVRQADTPLPRAANIADREHFTAHVAADTGRPVIGRPMKMRTLDRPGLVLSRRLNRPDGGFDGIVSVVINPATFTLLFRDIYLGDTKLIVMTGLDGFIRARSDEETDSLGQDVRKGQLFAEYAKRDEGSTRYKSVIDGMVRHVAFRKLDSYPLVITVGVTEDAIFAEVNGRARSVYFGAAVASLLALLAAAALVLMVRRRERDAIVLRNSEQRYRKLIEESPDATFVSRIGKILFANRAFLRLLGAEDSKRVIGENLLRFVHPDFQSEIRGRLTGYAEQEKDAGAVRLERRFIRFDGGVVDVETSGISVEFPEGWARHVVVRDITARKQAEAQLRESMERYRRMVEASPDATFINRADRIVYANPAAMRLLGVAGVDELVGKSPLDIVHPEDREAARARIERMEAGNEFSGTFEQRFQRADGTAVETEVSVSIVVDEGVRSRQVVARDIGARKRVEAAVRESEARYRRLVEDSPDATIVSRNGMILYANPATLRLLGAQSADQVVGMPVLRFVHPDNHEDARRRLEELEKSVSYAGAGLFERKYVRLDGSVVDVEISGVTVELADGPARHVVIRDVTARKKTEAALRDSEERYRMLVEASPDAVLIYTDDTLSFVNPAAVKLFGAQSREQLIGMTVQQLIHPSGQAVALARRAFVTKTGQPTGLWDQTFLRLDGTPIEVEGSTIGIAGTGNRRRMVTVRDISARKRAEEALRESEARLRMAVESASMTNWEWDIASDQTHWGYGHENLLGPLSENERKYPDFRSMVHPDDRARFLAAGRAAIEQGLPYEVEFRLVRSDGSLRWMRHNGRAIRDKDGRVEGMAGVMQDVTRRHDIERELAVSQQRRDALLESIPAPAWLKDRNGRFIAVNRAWYQRFNKDPGFAIGRTNADVFAAPVAEARDREDQVVFRTRKEFRTERMSRVDGREGWFETVKMPVFDENGEVSGLVGISFDTTARKQVEEKLRASEERFRQFADSMDDVFWIHELDPDKADYVNRAFQKIWGLEPELLLRNPDLWSDAVESDDRARVKALFAGWINDAAANEFHAEYRIVRPEGAKRWIRHFGTKLCDAAGKPYRLQGIAEDITAQRETELALAETRRRRDALLESNPEPAWLKDLQGRYIAVNRAWFTRRGLDPANIDGKTDHDFFTPERVAIILAEDRKVIETRTVLRNERNWHYVDGTTWIETIKAPVLDSDGNVTAIVGLSHDISERKRSEQAVQQMNETLAQQTVELTALNRELESFAYTVSHDLRAPLRHIDGFVNLIRNHAGPTFDAQSARYFDRVSKAARRMGQLIDDLLAFSRTGRAELRFQRVPLERLLRESIEHLKPDTAGRRIEWKIGVLPEVQGDAGLLAIVLQNLVSNAVKYTRPREVARIEIRAKRGDDGMTTLSVRDNGVGFDMQYQHKLFGVFQRLHTDAEFEGTGIGLATVARIVQRHGGRVWAEGVPGEGACFYVALPLAPKRAKAA